MAGGTSAAGEAARRRDRPDSDAQGRLLSHQEQQVPQKQQRSASAAGPSGSSEHPSPSMAESSRGPVNEQAPHRFYCPYPSCNRSFAELWRLKVHYRAPLDIRGSGKERGHGTELSHCPKCGKGLKPGKHHVGCTSGRSAQKRVRQRDEALQKKDQVGGKPHLQSPLATAVSNDASSHAGASSGNYGQDLGTLFPGAAAVAYPRGYAPEVLAGGLLPKFTPEYEDPMFYTSSIGPLSFNYTSGASSLLAQQQAIRPFSQAASFLAKEEGNASVNHTQQQQQLSPNLEPAANLSAVFDYDGSGRLISEPPSPPPLPPDFAGVTTEYGGSGGIGGGMLFNFHRLAPRVSVKAEASSPDRPRDSWGHDVLLNQQSDDDVMELLFGAQDNVPKMATVHLHHYKTNVEADNQNDATNPNVASNVRPHREPPDRYFSRDLPDSSQLDGQTVLHAYAGQPTAASLPGPASEKDQRRHTLHSDQGVQSYIGRSPILGDLGWHGLNANLQRTEDCFHGISWHDQSQLVDMLRQQVDPSLHRDPGYREDSDNLRGWTHNELNSRRIRVQGGHEAVSVGGGASPAGNLLEPLSTTSMFYGGTGTDLEDSPETKRVKGALM